MYVFFVHSAEAFRIYEEAAGISAVGNTDVAGETNRVQSGPEDGPTTESPSLPSQPSGVEKTNRRTVTDNMILGLVRAAVRGSKSLETTSQDDRRVPLDRISYILLNLEVRSRIWDGDLQI